MSNSEVMRQILDKDWTEADLRLAAESLAKLEASETDMQALRDFDRLRALLRQGDDAEAFAEPDGGWGSFEQRLMALTTRRETAQWPRLTLLAASVLIAASGWLLFLSERSERERQPAPIATERAADDDGALMYSADQIDTQVGMFRELSKVYEDHTAWVSLSESDSEIGLTTQPQTGARRLVLLRLSVDRDGQLISQSDLVIIPGEVAELSVPVGGHESLRYTISAGTTKPTRLSVRLEVTEPQRPDMTIAALATTLQATPGKPMRAGQLLTSSGGYQLSIGFQEANFGENGT